MKPKAQDSSVNGAVAIGQSTKTIEANSRSEPLLDSHEAAELLRIHPKTLQRMARKGEIPAIQIGRLWRFQASVLSAWVSQKLVS